MITLHQNTPEDNMGELIMEHLSRGGVDSPVCLEYIRFNEDGEFSIKCATGMKVVISVRGSNPHFDVVLC